MNCLEIRKLIDQPNANLIDVREPMEFAMDHVEGSTNIPLSNLPAKVGFFRSLKGPIVLFCVSGNRSGQARQYLKAHGIEKVYNAGGLEEVRSCVTPVV